MEKPSFAFAVYDGKTQGQSVKWVCFSGVFSVAMNMSMIRLLLTAIDAGGKMCGEEVELENEVADLANALEDIVEKEEGCVDIGMFRVIGFDNVGTIQCGLNGMKVLSDAVAAGADYSATDGKSLYAFVQEAENRIQWWERKLFNKAS